MEVIRNINNLKINKSVVCVGNFDGLHWGHREIVDKTISYAKQKNTESVVFSFWPHPQLILNPNSHLEYLYTFEEKIRIFESTGVDKLILFPFSREFASISSKSFILDYLIEKLKMSFFVIGYDHQFGKDREGNYQQLMELSKKKGFKVERVKQKSIEGINISSTKIRRFIKEGSIHQANKLMAHPFFIMGNVEHGKKIGNSIGFPTANILYPKQKIVPKTGVYLVEVELSEEKFYGIANLGCKPTISEQKSINLEVHIFNFKNNIYGQNLKVNLLQFIRSEKKFNNIDALKNQIKIDVERALNFIEL